MKKARPRDSDPMKYGCPTICESQINKEYFLSLHIPRAIFVFVGNLLADISYYFIDPRIKESEFSD